MDEDRSRPPEPEAPRPGEAGETPPAPRPEHALAHELREEIEEIVEHVPRPVRWTVRKLVLLVGLSLLGLLVLLLVTAVLYVGNRTEWAAQELTLLVNRTLAARTDLRLELADIKGNLVTGVRLVRPRLVFRDRQRTPFVVAREIRLGYRPWTLLGRDKGLVMVAIDQPEVKVDRGADGRLRWPRWKSEGRAAKGQGTSAWRLQVRGGSARLGDAAWTVRGLDAELDARVGPVSRLEVLALRWKEGPYRTTLQRCRATVEAGDSIRVRVPELLTTDLALAGQAAFGSGAEPGGRFSVRFSRLRFARLAEVFRNRTFDVPGEVSGRLEGRGRPWVTDVALDASWDGLPVDASGRLRWSGGHVEVAPLHGRSPAGELDGRLFWGRERWGLDCAARAAHPEHWGAIGLKGWPAGNLNGRFRYEVDTRRRVPDGRLAAWLGTSELAGWRVDTARVDVAFPADAPDSFEVNAFRRGGQFQLWGRSMTGGWSGRYQVAGLPLEEWPDGRKLGLRGLLRAGQGQVQGEGGRLAVRGELDGTALDWTGTRAARWRLAQLGGDLLPTADLQGLGQLEDVVFNGVHLDSVQGPFHLLADGMVLGESRAVGGDTLIVATGRVGWDAHGWSFTSERLRATSQQFAWVNQGALELRGDPAGVEFERFVLRDGDAVARCSGRWGSLQGTHDWQGEVSGLQLARAGLPAELGLGGRVDARLRVWGPGDAPRWQLEGRGWGVGFEGHVADSVGARLGGGPGGVVVDEGVLWVGGGRLVLHGGVEQTREAYPAALTPEGVRDWLVRAGAWQGALRADHFPLERVGALEPRAGGLKGQLSGELGWTGQPEQPVFQLRCEGEGVAWENVGVDHVAIEASYREGRLEVSRCDLRRGASTSTASGSLPLQLALREGRVTVPDERLDLHLDLPNGDLAVLPLFVPQVGYAAGTLAAEATVGGTAAHPDLAGWARVRNGRLRLATREEVVDRLDADLTLDETRLTLDSLVARQEDRGRVRANGYVQLAGFHVKDYRFDLTLRSFRAQETGIYAGEFDGDFVVQQGPVRDAGTLPRVTGDVNLRRAVVLFDFTNQSEVQQVAATTRPLYWVYGIRLEAKDGLRWRPPDADIEFAADLQVEQTLDSLLIYGEVHSVRGSYYFLSNQFQVESAQLTFDNVGGVDPQLDIMATTRVPRATLVSSTTALGPANEGGTEEVTATIQGRASNPTIHFTSTAQDADEPTILRSLTWAQFVQGDRFTLGEPIENYLTRMLSRQLSEQLSAALGGYVREWELSREQSGQLTVGLGTQVTREISLRYRQALPGYTAGTGATAAAGGLFERDVEAEYRLSRFVYLTTEIAQRRATAVLSGESSTTTDFNVNLKLRYEY